MGLKIDEENGGGKARGGMHWKRPPVSNERFAFVKKNEMKHMNDGSYSNAAKQYSEAPGSLLTTTTLTHVQFHISHQRFACPAGTILYIL